jgi:hypothetical protein
VALRKLYAKKDGTPAPPRQVSARVNKYPELFEKQGRTISLKRWRQ